MAKFTSPTIRHIARIALGTLIVLSLTQCIASNGKIEHTASHEANNMVIIGVPMLLGGFGSSVPINERYHITAKHVAQLSWDLDVIHHPYCDLSLVRSRTPQESIPQWGLIYPDQAVSHQGHSLLGTTIKGEGKYLQDVLDTNSKCLYSLSDAPSMSGMSGGPVFNAQGQIVGITVAILDNPEDIQNLRQAERYTQFVPATLIFDWLTQLGVSTSYASHELANIQVAPYIENINTPHYRLGVQPQLATPQNASQFQLSSQPQTTRQRVMGQTNNREENTSATISIFNHYAIVQHPLSSSLTSSSIKPLSPPKTPYTDTSEAIINSQQKQGDKAQNEQTKTQQEKNSNLINEIGYRPSYW
ncbi:serine protease [Photobacterium sanguinicancri]|uniref:serine protease n=1 Tax=Photobacterium sanguinicancri TaxID=875932 RepID=UPI0026E1BFA6|nr:serine protease [Photobacterium sanguinicancri]MDO6499886.1 serine protease [Photobacterium sanguinicancri]